ncbi:hypothetical protein Bca4012_058358 [Brassica carinata]
MESMPPPSDRKEIVLGLLAPSVVPLSKGRKTSNVATETVKKRRCTKGSEGEPSGLLPQHRAKFVSLVDGMISDCGLEIECLTKDLVGSREALRRVEATLKSAEGAYAAEVSQLETRVGDLERDLGKSASAFFKMSKEKRAKASEVRRLQLLRPFDEDGCSVDSLLAVRKKDLALAGTEGSLSEIRLLRGEAAPTLDSEVARLLSCKEELASAEGDFDSILSLPKAECVLTPCLEEPEGREHAVEESEKEEGDGDAVSSSEEVEDEGGAPRSA